MKEVMIVKGKVKMLNQIKGFLTRLTNEDFVLECKRLGEC